MSLVIVKASAIAVFENRTPTEGASANNIIINQNPQSVSHFQATTSEFITTSPRTTQPILGAKQRQSDINTTVTNHIIRTNIIVGGGGGSQDLDLVAKDNMRAKLQQLLQREKDDEEKRQLQQDQQQLQLTISEEQQQQQQQQQLQHLQQQHSSQHAILAGENAYLLERIDGGGVHEQPIYGTWSTKARRPQAPQMGNSIATSTMNGGGVGASSAPSTSMQTLIGEVNENVYDNHQKHHNHHYERLPRRSATMTPVRRELHDQIPRPPRLTSRQPSFALRRQFNETPLPRDESRPKPFHFPYDGPLPEEFKKQQQQGERASNAAADDVSNIHEILQKLQLGGWTSTKAPPLVMMPSALHISGTYKNLKSSGIANFFRGKRQKKQMQLQFPIPMQMLGTYPQPVMHLMPQAAYQQRIAMDQIYPFKPRSPNDINLLAMQQQHQQHVKTQQTKGKKQKKKQKDKKNPLASNNQMIQQYPFVTAGPDVIFPSGFPPFMAINVTQAPPFPKRVPFKLNLDIFPVLPPSKNAKPQSAYAMEEARIVSSMRPPTALRNPFMEYLSTPMPPSASAMSFYNPYVPKQPQFSQVRFPAAVQAPYIPLAQTNNMQLAYTDQMQKYLQQQQQQQLYANLLHSQGGHQTPFLPIDCDQPLPPGSEASSSHVKNGNIMVHLNVFPKPKQPTSNPPSSTNPFYSNLSANNNNLNSIHRTAIQEENLIDPRHQARSLNDTSQMKIARSDTSSDPQQDLVDFDHPIVAASDSSELPSPAALVENQSTDTLSSFGDAPSNMTYSNYNVNANPDLEQMVSEAKTASLFRFPVEDLIQFQVHDAM